MNRFKLNLLLLSIFAFLSTFLVTGSAFAADYGVFTKVAVNVPGSISSVTQKVESALNSHNWTVIGKLNTSLPSGDSYSSTVIVATNEVYDKYMADNGNYPLGAFGLPLRVAVYTTPNQGVVVSMLNLPALARTFSGNSYVNYAVEVNNYLKNAIREAVGGTPSDDQYGPMRSGRFPGGIGGGSFPGSVDQIANYSGSTDSNLLGVANLVLKGIEHNNGGWHLVYKIEKPSIGFIELGVTRSSTERHSIEIDSGARATSGDKFPGIDHSPAYPVEILIYRDGNYTDVSILGEMWRMKYYFADAGMMAFMSHMGMPGSIQGSLKQMILYGLAY
ncbi:MAG: hypothetical protein ACYCSB_01985 [bacterium]